MRIFILKMAAIFMLLLCVLVLESVLMGEMGMFVGLLLLGVCSFATSKLFQLSLKKAFRKKAGFKQRHAGINFAPAAGQGKVA